MVRDEEKAAAVQRRVTFRVMRFDPAVGEGKSFMEYSLDIPRGTTLLDALIRIKEEKDSTLSYRYSCRMGVCGSCGMYINGLPMLACQTQVLHLGSDFVEVRPLPNFDVVRDLATDLAPMFWKHSGVKPFIIRRDGKELDSPTGEYHESQENLDWIYQFTYCIKCGLCLSACPTVSSDPEFVGPQALAQAYRYSMDMRDEGFAERSAAVDHSRGPWRCHFASSCSQVCPKGVDPALGIQLLKREIVMRKLRLRKERGGSQVLECRIAGAKRKEGVPEPPPRSV